MIAVAQTFEVHVDRDDLAVEHAARRLSTMFNGDIREKGIDDETEDFNRLSAQERQTAAQRFGALAEAFRNARAASQTDKGSAIAQLRAHLGTRVPFDLSRVVVESGADTIRNTPASRVIAPVVLSSKAG